MAAKDDLKTGIKKLQADMIQFDGTEGKTQADGQEYYAEELAKLIDAHAKSLVVALSAADVAQTLLIAGVYPVAPNPVPPPINPVLKIVDPIV